MPIPEYNEIKAPALQLLADGKTRRSAELYTALATHFHLTDEEQNEMLPSGAQRRWHKA